MKAMKRGQTMVEYIIIVALIAVSLIAVFSYLSRSIGQKAAYAAKQIDSKEGQEAQSAADDIGAGKDAIKDLK